MDESTPLDEFIPLVNWIIDDGLGGVNFPQDEAAVIAKDAIEEGMDEEQAAEAPETGCLDQELVYDVVVQGNKSWSSHDQQEEMAVVGKREVNMMESKKSRRIFPAWAHLDAWKPHGDTHPNRQNKQYPGGGTGGSFWGRRAPPLTPT